MWARAVADSLRNGLSERARPAVSARRGGHWHRDLVFAVRRLVRAPAFVAASAGTLTVGLGMVAVVYTAVQKSADRAIAVSESPMISFEHSRRRLAIGPADIVRGGAGPRIRDDRGVLRARAASAGYRPSAFAPRGVNINRVRTAPRTEPSATDEPADG